MDKAQALDLIYRLDLEMRCAGPEPLLTVYTTEGIEILVPPPDDNSPSLLIEDAEGDVIARDLRPRHALLLKLVFDNLEEVLLLARKGADITADDWADQIESRERVRVGD